MQFFVIQAGLTLVLFLLRWIFIWTNTVANNVSWPIVNNLFFVVVLSWLFTLGWFVKNYVEKSREEALENEIRRLRSSNYSEEEKNRKLKEKNIELFKEKERFITMVENIIARAGSIHTEFVVTSSERAVIEQEKSVVSSFT
jgi:hypothetical protein